MTPKVLLVDDVTMFVELQRNFLALSSVTILTAKNGAEALAVCRAEHPALVIMDLHMPVMGGDECCTAIKTDPRLKATKVVLVTSAGRTEDHVVCLQSGCDHFITKPLERRAYLETARTYLPQVDRRDKRVPCFLKVRFQVFGVHLSGEIRDISAHGAYLATDYDVEQNTIIDLIFALPEHDGAIIQTKGRIAWINTSKARKKKSLSTGLGIQFIDLTDESRLALSRYVDKYGALP